MRSSSMKSIVATLSIVITLTFTLPATAAPRSSDPRVSRNHGNAIIRIVRELIKRVGGGITTNSGPSVPIGSK